MQDEAARASRRLSASRREGEESDGDPEEEEPGWEDRGLSGMMVLFVKQVHLQKVGAAGEDMYQPMYERLYGRGGMEAVHAAAASEARAPRSTRRMLIRRIVVTLLSC